MQQHGGKEEESIPALSERAWRHYRSKEYEKSMECLYRLQKLAPDDLRVAHNILVVQYYAGHGSEPGRFAEQFEKLRKRIEEKAAADGEDIAESEEAVYTAYAVYNQAVMLLHQRQYASALPLLELLFKNLEPLDDIIAVRTIFLLLEVYLRMRNLEKVVLFGPLYLYFCFFPLSPSTLPLHISLRIIADIFARFVCACVTVY